MSEIPAASGLPFDDIRRLLVDLPAADEKAVAAVRARAVELTKPPGSLGRLEELVEWLAAWQGTTRPMIARPTVTLFAASHGVTVHGISAFPAAVNRQMLENYSAGGAAINQLCTAYDIGLKVFDLAIDQPTPDIVTEAAMTEAGCAATMAYGMEAVADADLVCLGEMGIGNTTIAAAVYHGLYGGAPEDWVGPGTGLDAEGVARKAAVIGEAVRHHAATDPLEVLRRLGGREIAAIAGAILGARYQHIPVVLDGFVTTAAAAVLHAINPRALDHCLAGHCSAEPAHAEVLRRIGKPPLLELGMRLGEGTGAAIAVGVLKGALACWRDMATFETAGVSKG